jgi:Flp pilus assembly protein TadD
VIVKFIANFLISLILLGCVNSPNKSTLNYEEAYLDNGFDLTKTAPLETKEQIFAVSPQMAQYVRSRLGEKFDVKLKTERLVSDLFSEQQINIRYQHNANYIASETFDKGYANCLSLTILSYVLAKEANLDAKILDVKSIETWTVTDEVSLLNGHVNLKVSPKSNSAFTSFINKSYTIDFMPNSTMKVFKRTRLSENDIIALFYNNRGADELAKQNIEQAYLYFKSATKLAPSIASSWNNLASIYRQTRHFDAAEKAYFIAMKLDPNNLNVLDNLAILYASTNRHDEAKEIRKMVAEKRNNNPFYYSMLGEEATFQGNYYEAENHFKKAIMLDRREHSFHFKLAKVYIALGKLELASEHIDLAKKFAHDDADKKKYTSKASLLNQYSAKL